MSDETTADPTEKWLSASAAARKAEHHFPADCLAEAAHVARALIARAESAEAALAGLREGIETLADRWAGDPVGGDIWRSDAVDALRALLAPTPDHEEER